MSDTASIAALHPHPRNARRGDVAVIAESLRTHGQYAPVIVNADGTILAGHHVVAAARALGWDRVAVHRLDVPAATADRIVVADNRTSDLATYNLDTLGALLTSLPDLAGTGFTTDDLHALTDPHEPTSTSTPSAPPADPAPDVETVRVGPYRADVDRDVLDAWQVSVLTAAGSPTVARRITRERLGLPEPEPVRRRRATDTPMPPSAVLVETVPLDDLAPYPHNAREGDVGAIVESLREFGQYRPLVVSTDGVILKGNHTAEAMRHLSMTTAQVVRAPVTGASDAARRIVLVDNRASDLADYNPTALRELLTGLDSLHGTGYDGDDLDDLLHGGPARPTRAARGTRVTLGQITYAVARGPFRTWADTLPPGGEVDEIMARLGFPSNAYIP